MVDEMMTQWWVTGSQVGTAMVTVSLMYIPWLAAGFIINRRKR